MKTLILSAIRCSLMFLLPTVTYAISAQWDEAPMSDDWNTAANWKQNGVPNGRDDIATFGFSTTLSVSISEDTEVNGIVLTAEAPPRRYVIRSENHTLTISGTGITNNSGQQSIVADAGGHIEFTNNASATIEGGDTLFFSNLKALVSGGSGGVTTFSGDSHAANGDFFNHGGTFDGEEGGSTIFSDTSHADSASLMAFGGTNGGQGGKILFQGKSDGGTSSVEVFGNGTLDLSNHDEIVGRFTIGSIAGDGKVLLNEERTLNLFIGGNNLDTTFSGVILGSRSSDALVKEGTGTLTLSGNTEFLGDFDINGGVLRVAKGATLTGGVSDITIKGGVLQVDGTFKGGNTFINENGTLEGTGTHGVGDVEVRKGGRVIPGSDGAPGSLTIDGGYSSGSEFATLKIQIAGTNPGDFSVLTVDGFASLGGILEPVLLDGFMPKPGDTFDFLFYEDHIGEFASIANQFFGNLQWLITDSDYGDRMVTLEVVSRASPVPDQGSTFVLLTLGLLGLVTCQRQLLRRHA